MPAHPPRPSRRGADVPLAPGMMAWRPRPAGSARRTRGPSPLPPAAAYPGAPPRIPHELTPGNPGPACKTCHERGGYSQRFAAYVPVTPHPEEAPVCNVTWARTSSWESRPPRGPERLLPQCHGPSGGPPRAHARDLAHDGLAPGAADGARPRPLPHSAQTQAGRIASPATPGLPRSLRSGPHPERTNCRQCHVALDPEAEPFTRPRAGRRGPAPGARDEPGTEGLSLRVPLVGAWLDLRLRERAGAGGTSPRRERPRRRSLRGGAPAPRPEPAPGDGTAAPVDRWTGPGGAVRGRTAQRGTGAGHSRTVRHHHPADRTARAQRP